LPVLFTNLFVYGLFNDGIFNCVISNAIVVKKQLIGRRL